MAIQNERLTAFVQRIEKLAEEREGIAGDIKEVFAESKAAGYDTRVMKILLRERKMDRADLAEQQELLSVYRAALGDLDGTPLAKAAEPVVHRGARS